jgi:dUTP pyrophosphatase
MIKVKVRTTKNAILPKYQTSKAAGFDLHSTEEFTIKPGQRQLVKTGLFVELPDGYEMQVRPRSGLALKNGITVLNSPGTIDADYRGEIGIIIINHGQDDFPISIGDRIAQGVLAQVEQAEWLETTELSETQRGAGGFGSTNGSFENMDLKAKTI